MASLVGVSWNTLREAFIRKAIHTMVQLTPSINENALPYERMRHIFKHNESRIHRILYEFSFFVAGSRYSAFMFAFFASAFFAFFAFFAFVMKMLLIVYPSWMNSIYAVPVLYRVHSVML